MSKNNDIYDLSRFDELDRKKINFFYEHQLMYAWEGQTVAAALMMHNIKKLGTSRKLRQPRGVYCHNGWCGSCNMTIDGMDNIMACMTRVKDGMKVQQIHGDPDLRRFRIGN